MYDYMKIELINKNNVNLLQQFIHKNNSKKFRYYDKRNIDIIKNHLLTLIITIDEKIAGYGHLDKDDCVWLGICVLEEFRGKGLGNEIMKYMITYAKNNKIRNIYLTVDKDNEVAIGMYNKYGFIEIEDKKYCVKMELNLMDSSCIELPVSLGEALDKLTILDIKMEKITDSRKNDVEKEYNILYNKLKDHIQRHQFYYNILKRVNLSIWEMQDDFRDNVGDHVKLCFDIIEDNDRRFRIKRKINNLTNSLLKEQKGYKPKKAFVMTHQGLGDNITAIGMIRYLSTLYDKVVVVCKNKNKDNVKQFYEDDNSIELYCVNGDKDISPNFGFSREKFDEITCGHDIFMSLLHNLSNKNKKLKIGNLKIPQYFYEEHNIPFSYFWEYFYIPYNDDMSKLLNIVGDNKYVFIHNTASTGNVFNIDYVEKKTEN